MLYRNDLKVTGTTDFEYCTVQMNNMVRVCFNWYSVYIVVHENGLVMVCDFFKSMHGEIKWVITDILPGYITGSRQSYDCPSACEATLQNNIGQYQTTTNHSKAWTVYISLGVYCNWDIEYKSTPKLKKLCWQERLQSCWRRDFPH